MKKIFNSPVFYFSRDYFTGDNVAHYFAAKYLWYICNVEKKGFYQPVYDFQLNDEVSIDFISYPEQPQGRYFKKPKWINQFVSAKSTREANDLAKKYDYFVDNYRYRGARPQEINWGYSPDLNVLNLYIPAYTYKAVYDLDLYIDDLELADKYAEFLEKIKKEINSGEKKVIVIHHRGDDPWKRHLSGSINRYETLLASLLKSYPDHLFVLLGESWSYYHHPCIKYLNDYINKQRINKELKEYSGCLQYVLQAYYCRDADVVFIGISGFTLFVESIRPRNLMPPIPIFWGPQTYSGIDTCIASMKGWKCPEFEKYKSEHPEDRAFRHYVHHFLYYSRDEEILKPYCDDYPNDMQKIFNVLEKFEIKYRGRSPGKGQRAKIIERKLRGNEQIYEKLVNMKWKYERAVKKTRNFVKMKYLGLFKRIFKVHLRP